MNMSAGLSFVLAIGFFIPARAAEERPATRPTIESVQKENRKLREENDVLRRRIAKLTAATKPAATQPTTKPAAIEFEVTADVDGSDELHLTADGLSWKHKEWDWPANVTVNGKRWDPHEDMKWEALELEVVGGSGRPGIGRVMDRSGRDTVAVEPDDDGPVIYFSDAPGGADTYSIKFTLTGVRARKGK